jgi:hypothetical protein
MAQLTLTELQCIRKQDVVGKDEPVIKIAGIEVWTGKMGKGDTDSVNRSQRFDDVVKVELLERDNKKEKLLDSWQITETPQSSKTLTAQGSGYHYELRYDVT